MRFATASSARRNARLLGSGSGTGLSFCSFDFGFDFDFDFGFGFGFGFGFDLKFEISDFRFEDRKARRLQFALLILALARAICFSPDMFRRSETEKSAIHEN